MKTLIPGLEGEQYYGEFHFVGKKLDIQVTQSPDFRQVLREGISGLQQLASACEKDDARLTDLNYFIGESPIVMPILSRFGFELQEPPRRRQLLKDPVDFLRNMNGAPFSWLRHRKPMLCSISRDSLLEHKDVIDRFAQRESA